MFKKIVLSIAAVFVAWAIMDFVIHGLILRASYEATAQFWRPMPEMKMGLMYLCTLIIAFAFTCIYALLVAQKNIGSGVKLGVFFGLAYGVPMGFGTYSYMPIPFHMALVWCLGSFIESLVAGIIVGSIIKE
ncbi:MAG: hypothetical protein AB1473_01890 [Thermodesulfobacteriota bacterium]